MRVVICAKEVLDPDAANNYALAGRLELGDACFELDGLGLRFLLARGQQVDLLVGLLPGFVQGRLLFGRRLLQGVGLLLQLGHLQSPERGYVHEGYQAKL